MLTNTARQAAGCFIVIIWIVANSAYWHYGSV